VPGQPSISFRRAGQQKPCLTLRHEAGTIFAEGLAKVGGRVTGSILKLWLLDLLDEPGLDAEEEAAVWELSETIMRRESITLERLT